MDVQLLLKPGHKLPKPKRKSKELSLLQRLIFWIFPRDYERAIPKYKSLVD